MLAQLGLEVARAIPAQTLLGLVNGSMSLHGGVVRDTAGRIVAHLVMPAATAPFNAIPGVGLLTGLVTNYQLKSISEDVQRVLNISLANTALSGLTLATSVVSLVYLAAKIRQVDVKLESLLKQTREIKQLLQSQQRAQLLEAIDSLRHAGLAEDEGTRRQLYLQSKAAFGQLAHHYKSLMTQSGSLAEAEASEEFFTVACLGNVLCTSELGLREAARDDLITHYGDWKLAAQQQVSRALNLGESDRLLDGRYVEQLPARTLVSLLDFAKGTSRGIDWIDDLRQSLGKTTLLASAAKPLERGTIDYARKLGSRDLVLQSYVAHYSFLSEMEMSAGSFGQLLEDERSKDSADLLWLTKRESVV